MNKFLCVITASAMGAEAADALFDLRWMLVFIVWLIVADLWFSVSAKRHAKLPVSFGREWRRACNRLVDYLAYLMSGVILGLAIFEPLSIAGHTATAAAGLAMGCVWEIESIVNHVCSIHGAGRPFSVKRILWRMLKSKFQWIAEGEQPRN